LWRNFDGVGEGLERFEAAIARSIGGFAAFTAIRSAD
jgi:hypothetical protein